MVSCRVRDSQHGASLSALVYSEPDHVPTNHTGAMLLDRVGDVSDRTQIGSGDLAHAGGCFTRFT